MSNGNNGGLATATQNACKLCAPLGASLVFKGIEGAVPLLHGSQGCSTYIRRYLISHYKEPVDIACSNFAEETAIFGGAINLKVALDNIRTQYSPELVGVATTCLSETIGDDVPMYIREYRNTCSQMELPPIVQVSTPSYQGTHMQGFHGAVLATISQLAGDLKGEEGQVNVFPGMVSPADLRYLKEVLTDFGLPFVLMPDYSDTLDGPLWKEYQRIPAGGVKVSALRSAGSSAGSLEFGKILAGEKQTAGKWLASEYDVPCHALGLPIGIVETDRFFHTLEKTSGRPTPEKHIEERGRLLDCYVDGHKYVMDVKAAVYGEEDLVLSMAAFLSEIGVKPILCASGGGSGRLEKEISKIARERESGPIRVMEKADFTDIEAAIEETKPDLIIGHSKGYTMSRRMGIPLVRIGFPVHDRIGGSRLMHLGYRGAQQLFDRIVNTLLEKKQADSDVGYTYL